MAEDLVRVAETVDPRPEGVRRMAELHAVYLEGYRALEPLFPRLANSVFSGAD